MPDALSRRRGFQIGDRVRYTRRALKEYEPPNDEPGEVVEVDSESSLTVRWPYGLGAEWSRDVRRIDAA